MEAIKNLLAVLAGIIGVGTAFLTLYAKYLDVKKNAREADAAPSPSPTPTPAEPVITTIRADEPAPPFARYALPLRNPATIEQARQAVKAPATALIAAGLISLCSNLFIAGFGYVDQFVTPLTTETKNKQIMQEAARRAQPTGMAEPIYGDTSEATVTMTIFTLLSLSIASAAAIWAGYGMLNLKSYKLSVVGSFAIMAGGLFCCMGGVPIGVWSLVILFKPEVSSSFR